jgi:hypothetical protein
MRSAESRFLWVSLPPKNKSLAEAINFERRGYWRAAVAIAAKNARMACAVLEYGDDFKHEPAAA